MLTEAAAAVGGNSPELYRRANKKQQLEPLSSSPLKLRQKGREDEGAEYDYRVTDELQFTDVIMESKEVDI